MKLIISRIDELRTTVKISASLDFEVVEPFIQSAQDLFLQRYLGTDLIEVLSVDNVPERATELVAIVKMSLGPLAIWVGGAELSVRISDSGMTVEKNANKFLPASDAKISNVVESLERRGFQYLDKALEYLEENKDDFPEWTESRYYTLRTGNYIRSAVQFQELAKVDINYSRMTFENLRPTMSNIEERFITDLLGDELDSSLRTKLDGTQSAAESKLIDTIRKYVACKTAELYSSEASKQNRRGAELKEYKPLIRPVYVDTTNTGNFYAEQAAYYLEKVQQTLIKYAVEFGITVPDQMVFNSDDQHIFYAG